MNYTVKTFLFIILNLVFLNLFAQKSFQTGVVFTNENDTINGLIDYREWSKNPSEIVFKTSESDKEVLYTTNDILGFQVNNETYISKEVEVISADIDISKPKEIQTRRVNVFVQIIISSMDKSLYFVKGVNGEDNFYINVDEKLMLLEYKEYEKDGKIHKNNKYQGQLILFMSDCSTIQPQITTTSYTAKSLSRLFNNYYKCTSRLPTFQKKEDKIKLEPTVLAGITRTTINFKGAWDYHRIIIPTFTYSNDITLGVSLNAVFPRQQGRWALNNEFLYTNYKVTGVFNNSQSTITTDFRYAQIKWNKMIRVNFQFTQLIAFGNIGLSNGFTIIEDNNQEIYYSEVRSDNQEPLNDTKKHELGLLAGLGIGYGKFSLEGRLEFSDGMSKYTSLSSNTTRYYLLLGYRFN